MPTRLASGVAALTLLVGGAVVPSVAAGTVAPTPWTAHARRSSASQNTRISAGKRRTNHSSRHSGNQRNSSQISGGALDCVYSALSQKVLEQFDRMVGKQINCVQVYNGSSATWAQWDHPWFLNHQVDANWTTWATAPGTTRQLIISQTLIPTSVTNANWLAAGASGEYRSYATTLAENLVAAGLGHTIIRLAPEMNGNWNIDSVGDTASQMHQWIQFWRNTVLAMRAVPGAHFQFDWSINAAVRPLPLSEFYPGNDVVDIIGIDAYDQGVSPGLPRWSTVYNRTDGIYDVLSFARAHRKPLSIPEWGLAGTDVGDGGGNDPDYVQGIANIVQNDNVAYQCYFYKYDYATQLQDDASSLKLYRRYFGGGS
jgi:hypothetical protein